MSEEQRRQAGLELAEIVRLAAEYDLPLPVEPTRTIDGIIVHPTTGSGLRSWAPPPARPADADEEQK